MYKPIVDILSEADVDFLKIVSVTTAGTLNMTDKLSGFVN